MGEMAEDAYDRAMEEWYELEGDPDRYDAYLQSMSRQYRQKSRPATVPTIDGFGVEAEE